jgi:RNA polymerase sporulation-specific sigma factor
VNGNHTGEEGMADYAAYTDEELIGLLRGGDEHVMEYLLEKYKNLVRKKANAMYLIGGENEDLIQEGMIGLFRAIRDYDASKEASFFRFADVCISRQIYTAIEASRRQKHSPLNFYVSLSEEPAVQGGGIDAHVESPEMQIIHLENVAQMQKKIDKALSPLEREVLEHYLEGYNYRQIAKRMDKPPKSIDNALQRIRGKISHLMVEV